MTKKLPKVELVVVKGHQLKAENSIVVLVDPLYADWIQGIGKDICTIVGHDRVLVMAIPDEAIKFYQVEHDQVVLQASPQPKKKK